MTDAIAAIESALSSDLAEIDVALREAKSVRTMILDIQGEYVFESLGTELVLLGADGNLVEHPMQGRLLLAGQTPLLDPREAFPLGRADVAGVDTTGDLDAVTRVVAQELGRIWRRVAASNARQRSLFAGRIEWERDGADRVCGWMLDVQRETWADQRW